MAGMCEGQVRSYKDGRMVARRQYLCLKVAASSTQPLNLDTSGGLFDPDLGFMSAENEETEVLLDPSVLNTLTGISQEEKNEISDALADNQKHILQAVQRSTRPYRESTRDIFPPIGTRVRRGPDWRYGDQDSDGPGTIIGHIEEAVSVHVEWDADGHTNNYRYGGTGYDLVPVEEPRILKPGEDIAVGCQVRVGKDGNNMRIDPSDVGVVIGKERGRLKVHVRWMKSGRRGQYLYGADGKFEVMLWQMDMNPEIISNQSLLISNEENTRQTGAKPKRNKNVQAIENKRTPAKLKDVPSKNKNL